jgi:pimeloyl-ACP methyl ester carboxylesterase
LAAVMRTFHKLAVTEEELRKNTVPSLTIIGSEDGLLPGAEALAERMTNHKLVILEGKNHFSTPSTDAFLKELLNFLAKNTPAP